MASRLRATVTFTRIFFQLLQVSRQRPSFSAHRAAQMTKTDLIFPAFSLRYVDFAVQFQSGLTVAWFSSTNYNSLLRIETSEVASFCIDNRLPQMAFFLHNVVRTSECGKTSKCGKNISYTLSYRLVYQFFVLTLFWRHLWSITKQTHGNMESIC